MYTSISNNKLGSFEGYNLQPQLGDFGQASNQQYLQQVQADLNTAQQALGTCGLPRPSPQCFPNSSWRYWEFKNKTAQQVVGLAPQYIRKYAEAHAQSQSSGPSAGQVIGGATSIVGAALGPLIQGFVSQQSYKAKREALRARGSAPAYTPQPQPVQQGGLGTGAIIAIAAGGLLMMGMMFMMMK
jgi:hypothetical protein